MISGSTKFDVQRRVNAVKMMLSRLPPLRFNLFLALKVKDQNPWRSIRMIIVLSFSRLSKYLRKRKKNKSNFQPYLIRKCSICKTLVETNMLRINRRRKEDQESL
jgi:hypothetical protein